MWRIFQFVLSQGRSDGGAVQGVPGEGAAHARGGRQGARGHGAGVNAAGPVGHLASGPATQETLHRRRRNGGEQADAVHAVVAQALGLAGTDAVESFHGQRPEPVRDLAGPNDEDAARPGEPPIHYTNLRWGARFAEKNHQRRLAELNARALLL